jgi:hypothetical protein
MSPTSYQAAPPRAFTLRNLALFCNRAYTRHATNLLLIAKDVRNSDRVCSLTFKLRDTNGDTNLQRSLKVTNKSDRALPQPQSQRGVRPIAARTSAEEGDTLRQIVRRA